jgi:hypothetical protein
MNKKEKKIMLVASIVMFVIMAGIFALTLMHYWSYWFGLEKWNLYTYVNVTSDRGGFDLNNTALTFGKIPLGGAAKRYIEIDNTHPFPIEVEISSEGTISPMLVYNESVIIDKGVAENISFSAVSTRNTTLGFYDGFVHFKTVPAV